MLVLSAHLFSFSYFLTWRPICKKNALHLTLCPSLLAGPFVKKMFVIAPPSTEHFLLKVEDYVPGYKTKKSAEVEEDSDSETEELRKQEAN